MAIDDGRRRAGSGLESTGRGPASQTAGPEVYNKRASEYDGSHTRAGEDTAVDGKGPAWPADLSAIVLTSDVLRELPRAPLIADIGCGTGNLTVRIRDFLVSKGFSPTMHGFDLNEPMLNEARRKDTTTQYQRLDASDPDATGRISATYDMLLYGQFLSALRDPGAAISNMGAHLRSGGLILACEVYSRAENWTSLTPAELKERPLALVNSPKPLADVMAAAGSEVVCSGLLPKVTDLWIADNAPGDPVGSRYFALGRWHAQN